MKNKKILLLLLLIISIIIIIIAFFIIRNNNINTDDSKIKKGYEIFGSDYCNGHGQDPIIVDGWPSYSTCKICGIEKHNDVPHSDFTICTECAKITGRCSKCGKILKK